MEHELCKGCKWNNYPTCSGTIMGNGEYMIISNLKETFQCGQKDLEVVTSLVPKKTKEQLKIEELEARLESLENR